MAAHPAATQSDLVTLVQTARAAAASGDTETALSAYQDALELVGSAKTANAAFLNNEIALLHRRASDFPQAQRAASEALAAGLAVDAPPAQTAVYALNLGRIATDLEDDAAAINAFTIAARVAAPNEPRLHATALTERAKALQTDGQHQEALVDLRAALPILEADETLLSEARDVRHLLIRLLVIEGRVSVARDELNALFARYGRTDALHQTFLLEARVLIAEGRHREAERNLRSVLQATGIPTENERLLRAAALYNLAEIKLLRGRYPEAARLNLQAQADYAAIFSIDHSSVTQTQHRQAILLQLAGDLEGSLRLFDVVLARLEARFGPEHPSWVSTQIERTRALSEYGQSDEALRLLRSIVSDTTDGREGQLAQSALGLRLFESGDIDAARPVLEVAVAAWRTGAFGFADAPPTMLALAEVYVQIGNPTAALRLASEAELHLVERGASAIDRLSEARRIEAEARLALGNRAAALVGARANLETAIAQLGALAISASHSGGYSPKGVRAQTGQLMDLLWDEGDDLIRPISEEMFRAIQVVHINETSAAALGTFAQVAAGADALYAERESVLQELTRLSQQNLSDSLRNADNAISADRLIEIARLEDQLAEIDASARASGSDLFEFLTPRPVSLDALQANLEAGEALWIHAAFDETAYIALIRPDSALITRSDLDAEQLGLLVGALKDTLDLGLGGIRTFDAETAQTLYDDLLAPFALTEVSRLYITPDGAAQKIPFSTLVLGRHDGEPVRNGQDNRDLSFLGHEIGLATLPSPQLLLSAAEVGQEVKQGVVGFGDPVLNGEGLGSRRGLPDAFDQLTGLADPGLLRSVFEPLPEAREELEIIATIVGDDAARMFYSSDATETRVKALDFGRPETLIFATHALVSGELKDLGEPALVMTPPTDPSDLDDGLLLASEVAALNLQARLVILSACNTGSGSGKLGAPGLSGLARAFWLAGAENLLVSHWKISSLSARLITPEFYAIRATSPDISNSEALRLTMRQIPEVADLDFLAHPAFWAAFSVVGVDR
ncbi:MAG: CHAT domain-containing protein [Pseudomonadota bacterium]